MRDTCTTHYRSPGETNLTNSGKIWDFWSGMAPGGDDDQAGTSINWVERREKHSKRVEQHKQFMGAGNLYTGNFYPNRS